MVKKGQQQTAGGPPPLVNRDLFHRVNFALQASAFLQTLGESSRSGSQRRPTDRHDSAATLKRDVKGKGRATDAVGDEASIYFAALGRAEMRATKAMAVHTQLKLDPSLKRAVCSLCGTVLIPGLTSRIRIRPDRNHGHRTHEHCSHCTSKRSIPIPPLPECAGPDPTRSDQAFTNLDGPVRQRRRARQAKCAKVPFHEREAVTQGDDVLPQGRPGQKRKAVGHTLWKGSTKVSGWGTGVASDS